MILAFPTETLEDFEESMELVRKYKFPSLFINQYYPRSGTPAARLKKIDTVEARKRTAAMSELFRSYTRYTDERIGELHRVLVTEVAADKLHGVGHNKSYEQILVPLEYCKMGEWIEVRVTAVTKFSMISKPASIQEDQQPLSLMHLFPLAVFCLVLITLYSVDRFLYPGFFEEWLPFLADAHHDEQQAEMWEHHDNSDPVFYE
ncbi:TRAM domain-containing protein [Caenorhabditis elegans]|nr:TRAM domain-containing protein [Caenorhabditis elegans]CDM63530.1 TRAM domain-containing protein [Caenorhabditis elegans]|eukprot:NP_001293428.1 Threonylcarbamoyladenosine tRNA methylthiotransferase [Caenorhabditis elegans]